MSQSARTLPLRTLQARLSDMARIASGSYTALELADTLEAINKLTFSESAPVGKPCFPKAVAWIRPWDGDVSDEGNFVIEWGLAPPSDNLQWTPLYAEDETVYESIK